MSSSKKTVKYNKESDIRFIDMVVFVYLVAITGIYPWIMQNKYFNITITRYKFFMIASISFVVLGMTAMYLDHMLAPYIRKKQFFFWQETIPTGKKPEFWILAFLFANAFSLVTSIDTAASATGVNGRYLGFYFVLVTCLMMLVLSQMVNVKPVVFVIFVATSLYSNLLAIYQHFESLLKDTFLGKLSVAHLKDTISSQKQKNVFFSSFGNINIYASFLALSVPIFFAILIFGQKKLYRYLSGGMLFCTGFVLMICNSDSAYLGIGAASVFLFFMALLKMKMDWFFLGLSLLTGGHLSLVLLHQNVLTKYDKRGGIAQATDKLGVSVMAFAGCVAIFLVMLLIKKYLGTQVKKVNRKILSIVFAGLMIVGIVVVVAHGIKSKSELFTFNYKWGTYRGYIWQKSEELYEDATMTQKLFGYGQESLKALMNEYYQEEMIEETGKTYDNAHNELLHYLISIGLIGVICYLGMVITSFMYIFKRGKELPFALGVLAGMIGYFAQALINVAQPITTPFFFVLMAVGIGYVRNSRVDKK